MSGEACGDRWGAMTCTLPMGHDRMHVDQRVASDGDSRCQHCGGPNPVWRADNAVWNAMMPNDGILCPTCFMLAADERMGRPVWVVTSEPTKWPDQ